VATFKYLKKETDKVMQGPQ